MTFRTNVLELTKEKGTPVGLSTTKERAPAVVTKDAGNCTVIEVADTALVMICWLFTSTSAEGRKPVPAMTTVVALVAAGLAGMLGGVRPVITGTGIAVMLSTAGRDVFAFGADY